MTETFQIKQDLNFFETLNAATYLIARTKMIQRLVIFLCVINAGSFFLGLATTQSKNKSTFVLLREFFFSILFIPVLIFALLTLVVIIIKIIRPTLFTNATYYFNNWGMQKTGKGGDFSRPWSGFVRMEESKNFIFLRITEMDAHIIQKRMFENYSDMENFREFVHGHLG